ncbi:MAG: F0F1 ATP synthase subunit B [Thermodesulfobacteriota bacterium]|nr:F0F1 ATP synthase subunit B [Thermodesulfobacteriota bacterium]
MKEWFSKNPYKRSFLRFLLPVVMIVILTSVMVHASGGSDESHGNGGQLLDFSFRALNFAVFIGIIYWLVRDKIKEFFSGRRTDIKISLEEAIAAKEEAEKKFKEYSAKLDKATEEINEISEMIRTQGLSEKEKIIESARITAEKIKEDAQTRIEQETKKAKSQLRAEAVELSIQMAEEILKSNVKEKDHENIVKDYLKSIYSQTHSGQTDTK